MPISRRALDNESTTSGGVAWLAFCPVRRRVAVGGSVLISGMATDITVVLILFQKALHTMNGEARLLRLLLLPAESRDRQQVCRNGAAAGGHDTRLLYYFNGCVIIPKLRSLILRTIPPSYPFIGLPRGDFRNRAATISLCNGTFDFTSSLISSSYSLRRSTRNHIRT